MTATTAAIRAVAKWYNASYGGGIHFLFVYVCVCAFYYYYYYLLLYININKYD